MEADRRDEISQSLRRAVLRWIEETNLNDNELQFWSDIINVAFRSEVVPSSPPTLTSMALYSKSHSSSLAVDKRNQEIKSALMSRLLSLVQESQLSDVEWSRWIRPINELSNLDFSKPDAEVVYSSSRTHINPNFIEAALGSSGPSINDAARPSTSSSTWPSSSTPEPPDFMSAGTLLTFDPASEIWGFANNNESSSSNEYTVVFEMCRDADGSAGNEEDSRAEVEDADDGDEADNAQRCDDTEAVGVTENSGETEVASSIDEPDNVHGGAQSKQAGIDNDNISLGMR